MVRYFDDIGVTVFAGCFSIESEACKKLKSEVSDCVHLLQMDVTDDNQVKEARIYIEKFLTKKEIGLYS